MATEAGSRKLSWYCKHCSRGSVKLFSRLLKLESAHDETRETQIKLVSEIKEVKNDMDKKNSDITARLNNLEGEIEAVKSALDGEGKDPKVIRYKVDNTEKECTDLQRKCDLINDRNVDASSDKVKEDLAKDLLEKATNNIQRRMDRKNNIIVHGAPEEVSGELDRWVNSEKIKHDKAIILELCLEINVECYVDDILNIKRIGKFKSEVNQISEEIAPRPIIVTLKEGIKEKIMRNVYRLKDTGNRMLKRIRVSHDMTQEERRKDEELRMEARRRNEEGTDNFFYVVRGNPWERYIMNLKKRETQEASGTPPSEGEGQGQGED